MACLERNEKQPHRLSNEGRNRGMWFELRINAMILGENHARTLIFMHVQSIRREAPRIGGSFAVWGGLFSTFDCSLVALRKKGENNRVINVLNCHLDHYLCL